MKFTMYKLEKDGHGMARFNRKDDEKKFDEIKKVFDYHLFNKNAKDFINKSNLTKEIEKNTDELRKITKYKYKKASYIIRNGNLYIGGYDINKNIADVILYEMAISKDNLLGDIKIEVGVIRETKDIGVVLQDICDKLSEYYDNYSLPTEQEVDISNLIEDIVNYGKMLGKKIEQDIIS